MPEERKLVTILFADVIGSTALGEQLDPEDVRALMSRYNAHARRVVEDYGGALEKFIGDAVVAVFGLPQAHGNDIERALAAALALFAAVAADDVLGDRVQLHAGVNTGDVVVSRDVAGGDFLITGDAVNVAARLEQAAAPGEILVSKRTAGAAQASFLFSAARTIKVKGKSKPLRVLPLASQRPTRKLGRPPLVGRKLELAQLEALCNRTLVERHPQLISLIAPAGTGKTRLLQEFLDRLDPRAGFRVATARCAPYGQTLTYWPLHGLLEELLDGALVPARVVEAFAASGHANEDALRLARLVLATLGIGAEDDIVPDAGRESISNAWRLLIEALVKDAPRIILFEDLHWASESLLDLVEHIMHPHSEAALLIIATGRPELLDHRPTWGGGRLNFTALALEPLSVAQAGELVGKLAKQMPAAMRAQIVERSGGNPFFIIELTRALAERGFDRNGSMPVALPDTVQGAVQERLDLLSAGERTVLQAASVAGRQFRPATLASMLDTPAPTDIDTALDGLLERDLITPAEDGAFTFRHILIRDVAYNTLARTERIRMHAAVAAWLEEFAASRVDEFVGLIAYHYREAALLARLSAVPLAVAVDSERTVYYLQRAGEVASRAGSYMEARAHLQNAIDLAPESEYPRLYETLGDCLVVGDVALAAYRRTLDYWRAGAMPDPVDGARLLRKLLTMYLRWGGSISDRPSATEIDVLRAEAHQAAEASGDEYETWRISIIDLFWPSRSGKIRPEEAPAQMAEALEAAAYFEARGDWAAFSEALDAYTVRAGDICDYEAACEASRRRLAAPALTVMEHSDAMAMLAWGLYMAGEYDDAVDLVRSKLARPGEALVVHDHAVSWAILAAYIAGRWSDATDLSNLLEEAWQSWKKDRGYAFQLVGTIALLLIAHAREDRAALDHAADKATLLKATLLKRPLSQALLQATERDDPAPLPDAMRAVRGWVDIFKQAPELAIMFLSERDVPTPHSLLDLLATDLKILHYDALDYAAAIARALADGDDARLASAIDDAEAHNLVTHAARMRIVLARHTGDPTSLAHARSVLEQLDDRQFQQRLAAVAAALR